jgi:hypothetical protein
VVEGIIIEDSVIEISKAIQDKLRRVHRPVSTHRHINMVGVSIIIEVEETALPVIKINVINSPKRSNSKMSSRSNNNSIIMLAIIIPLNNLNNK